MSLLSSSWVLSSFIIVIPAIIISLLILWTVRKTISRQALKKHHDVAGFTFSIIGVLYSVILGFTVINVQNRYNEVLQTMHTEAILLADLYQDAAFFRKDECCTIRESLRNYISYVMKEEWWTSAEKTIRPETQSYLRAIWASYYGVHLENEKMSIWYKESISKLNKFMNTRLARRFNSWEHLGSMMWSLLIIGAAMTICFMFFFGLESLRSHMLMTALLAGYLSFLLYLVFSLDNVYRGPHAIKPIALEEVYTLFGQWDKESLNTCK
jgi:hypothetical protein